MATTTALPTASDPISSAVLLRDPEPELRYGFVKRFADSFAGWRDRRVLVVTDGEASSPWLQRHHFECDTRLESEHRAGRAALAQLDQTIVAEHQKIALAAAAEAQARDSHADLAAQPLSDEATTSAEASDNPAVRLARRERTRRAELGRLDAQAVQQRAIADASTIVFQTHTTARSSHWAVMQVRGSHIIAHYNRRAATYVRAASRGHGELVRTPFVTEPGWLTQPAPATPDTTRKDI